MPEGSRTLSGIHIMNLRNARPISFDQPFIILMGVVCLTILSSRSLVLLAQQPAAQPATGEEEASLIPDEQLDSMVAPIALYPDPLLAQTLAASTYPLEIIQLQQFMANNKDLKDKALAESFGKLALDASVQSLAAFPDVVKQLGDHVSWTMDLGNAFLAQQSDVMDAVQRMRTKAQDKGN